MQQAADKFLRGDCQGQKECVINKAEFRHSLALYVTDVLRYQGDLQPSHKDHFIKGYQDETRYYYGAKLAKDFTILTGRDNFELSFIKDQYFERGTILNYLNEMGLNLLKNYMSVLFDRPELLSQDLTSPDQPLDYYLSLMSA